MKILFLVCLTIFSVHGRPQDYDYQQDENFNGAEETASNEPGVIGQVTGLISSGIQNVQNFFSAAVGGTSSRLDGSNIDTKKRPVVFFDVTADDEYLGRIHIELFSETVPKTVENFRQLVSGQNGFGYKKSTFHRVIPGFMLQGGDFTNNDGTGGYSIYGKTNFEDENFIVPHASKGMLSMANAGPDTNGSQFFITVDATPWLDGKHVVFGRVADVASYKVVEAIEKLGSASGETKKKIVIADSGQIV